METWGERVRRYRRHRRLTQEQLAEAAEIDRRYIGRIEVGEVADPNAETVRKLARALQIPARTLSEPLGWVPLEEDQHPADAFVVGGRNMSALTDADREVVLQVAERLREIAERSGKS